MCHEYPWKWRQWWETGCCLVLMPLRHGFDPVYSLCPPKRWERLSWLRILHNFVKTLMISKWNHRTTHPLLNPEWGFLLWEGCLLWKTTNLVLWHCCNLHWGWILLCKAIDIKACGFVGKHVPGLGKNNNPFETQQGCLTSTIFLFSWNYEGITEQVSLFLILGLGKPNPNP